MILTGFQWKAWVFLPSLSNIIGLELKLFTYFLCLSGSPTPHCSMQKKKKKILPPSSLLFTEASYRSDKKTKTKSKLLSRVQLRDLMDYTYTCCPWNSVGQNTGVGNISLLQGNFPTQGRTQVSWIAGGFFTSWATREAQEYWSG